MKRLFDFIVSLLAIIFLIPVFLIIALAIKFDSKGPVLFKQVRVGLNGNEFLIYKFRSMVIDAANIGPYFTQANDNRITKVGAFIRRTSIDELPQILNVLKGEMSVVGPRPNVPAQREQYNESQWSKRNSVRPGITGLAQATLRSEATPEQRTQLDIEYVDSISIAKDLQIIYMTVKHIFLRNGN